MQNTGHHPESSQAARHARVRLVAHGLLVGVASVAPLTLVIVLAIRDVSPWTIVAVAALLEVAGVLLLEASRGP